ncbi:hypothetical protein E4U10_006570 [Claviceps purpurea]|nr:hypothetical protein E4U10_006570 [Claviceps purpurea]
MAASNAAAAARIGAQAESRVPSPHLPIQSNGSEEKDWRPAGGLSQSYPDNSETTISSRNSRVDEWDGHNLLARRMA